MSLLPFPSFVDDVQEKGLRKAVMEGVDETVERITAGMNIQDIREALRGEPPSRRPNPRLAPHADGFWLHMRPGYFHEDMTGVYPTFRLGWLSTYFVVFETITGLLLMLWYTPSPQIAYGNMLNMLANVPLGQFTRDMHRLGAEAMVLIVSLHMMRTWVTASYKKPRQFTWFTGVLLLVFTGLLSFTGYLLPWDQLALWAVTIGASMAEATPLIGEQVNLIVRGAPELGANGLLRFYLLHVLALPVFLFIFTGVHYYKVVIHGHSLPPQKEEIGEDTAKRVPLDKRVYFIPDIMTNEILWIAVTTFIMVILCVWFYHAPLENHADPQSTPLGTTAPWYFLWIQGALKLGDKFLWGIAFPTVVIGLLAAMPYIDVTKSRRFAHRRLSLTIAALLVSVATILSYMGLAEFAVATSGEIEIVHELTMEPAHSHVGPMRTVPFDELVPGMYTTMELHGNDPTDAVNRLTEQLKAAPVIYVANDEGGEIVTRYDQLVAELKNKHNESVPSTFRTVPSDAPDLHEILVEMDEMLEERRDELPNAIGIIIVTGAQENLRRVDLAIMWDSVTVEAGQVLLGTDGEPLKLEYRDADDRLVYVATNQAGDILVTSDSNAAFLVYENPNGSGYVSYDADDSIVTDADGQPVVYQYAKPLAQRGIYSDHIYINEESAYFE